MWTAPWAWGDTPWRLPGGWPPGSGRPSPRRDPGSAPTAAPNPPAISVPSAEEKGPSAPAERPGFPLERSQNIKGDTANEKDIDHWINDGARRLRTR